MPVGPRYEKRSKRESVCTGGGKTKRSGGKKPNKTLKPLGVSRNAREKKKKKK